MDAGALAGACVACGTLHHVGCFAERAGCSVHGCDGARARATRVGQAPPLDFAGLLCAACNQPVAQDAMVARCSGCTQSLHVACYERLSTCTLGSRGLCRGSIEVLRHVDAAAMRARRVGNVTLGIGAAIAFVSAMVLPSLGVPPEPSVIIFFCISGAIALGLMIFGLTYRGTARRIESLAARPRPRPPPPPEKPSA
jgi:hypothetical protein